MINEWTNRLQELLQQDLNNETDAIFKPIAAEFEQTILSDKKEKLATFLAEEDDRTEEDFAYKLNEEFSVLQELIAQYRAKKKAIREERAKQERENYITKKSIVDKIAKITSEEEHIGKAFSEFKPLQEKWNETGRVPGDQHKDLMADYYKAVEDFYYNISLYKDLQEYDFKKNLEAKTELVEKIKTLVNLDNIKELDNQAKTLQQQWYDLGPVPREDFEALKVAFKTALDNAYNKIKELKEKQEKEQEINLEKKIELLEKVKKVAGFENHNAKDWDKSTTNIKALQEEWKTIGFGPKKENEKVWNELRTICDAFFEKKKAFFAGHREKQDEVKTVKEQLIAEAKKWQDSNNWKVATDKFIQLQERWKKAGAASQRDENKLWKEFRDACDVFFNKKKEHFKSVESEQTENLEAKQNLLKEIEAFKLTKDKNADLNQLKSFTEQWNGIGRIPKNKLDEVNGGYRNLMDNLFNALDIDAQTLEREKFEAKIKGFYQDENADNLIAKEKDFIRKKIDELNTTKAQYENNMAFISTANADKNPLLKGALKQLEQTNEAILFQKEKLKLIRELKPKAVDNAE